MAPDGIPVASPFANSGAQQTLVIGSPATAQDGSYQAAIIAASSLGAADKQMVDRILDEATDLRENYYTSVVVLLSSDDYEAIDTDRLIAFVAPAMKPLGIVTFAGLSSSSPEETAASRRVLPALGRTGLTLTKTSESPHNRATSADSLVAQKAAPSSDRIPQEILATMTTTTTTTITTSATTAAPLAALPLRRGKSDKSSKKAIWALSSAPSTPPIDASALLTAEDLKKPTPTCEPFTAGAPRRKKACKGCTCGLAEIEAAEADTVSKKKMIVVLDGEEVKTVDGNVTEVKTTVKKTVTSSCGSCYLGDAFRCASCPYLGLPAFEPGQKVEIDMGMDDI